MLEVIAIDTSLPNIALAMVERILSDRISRKMVLTCKGIGLAILDQVYIVITMFATN